MDRHAVDGGGGGRAGGVDAACGGALEAVEGAALVGGALPGQREDFGLAQRGFRVQGGEGGDVAGPFGDGHGQLLPEAASEAGGDAGGGAGCAAAVEKGTGRPSGVARRSAARAR